MPLTPSFQKWKWRCGGGRSSATFLQHVSTKFGTVTCLSPPEVQVARQRVDKNGSLASCMCALRPQLSSGPVRLSERDGGYDGKGHWGELNDSDDFCKGGKRAAEGAQWVGCLPTVHNILDYIPSITQTGWWCAL